MFESSRAHHSLQSMTLPHIPGTSQRRSPFKFFLLVFALAIPFWLFGATTGFELLPRLPVAALMFICPVTAAIVLVYGEKKSAGVRQLLGRAFDFKRIKNIAWYIPVLLLMPAVMVLSFGVLRLMGESIPIPQCSALSVLGLFLIFFLSALCEELGWSGYITDPMQNRWGALQAGILLGLVWAIWHWVPLTQAHRSPAWIAWWSLWTIAQRVLIVWIYSNTGRSVFAAALFHTTPNVAWQLFPINGSYFDPRVTGLITTLVAALVAMVWGPRTLARYRKA
jgi:uncharacterized protein